VDGPGPVLADTVTGPDDPDTGPSTVGSGQDTTQGPADTGPADIGQVDTGPAETYPAGKE
jgi:hypothetical protein